MLNTIVYNSVWHILPLKWCLMLISLIQLYCPKTNIHISPSLKSLTQSFISFDIFCFFNVVTVFISIIELNCPWIWWVCGQIFSKCFCQQMFVSNQITTVILVGSWMHLDQIKPAVAAADCLKSYRAKMNCRQNSSR